MPITPILWPRGTFSPVAISATPFTIRLKDRTSGDTQRMHLGINPGSKTTGLALITGIRQEQVRFDTQKLDNPEISGVEYQQGTLLGYT